MDVTIVLLGATGDLTKRKIIPAVYRLLMNRKISKLALVGVARRDLKVDAVLRDAKKFVPKADSKVWKKIERSSHYFMLDFYDDKHYVELAKFVNEVEKKQGLSGNRLFYFATAPQHFDPITHRLSKTGITKVNWSRLVYEKPFGHDLKSAKKINECLNRIFNEKQIYRIDHYLGKELVGDIALVRFTNRILEPLWCRNHVESVQLIFSEDIDVGTRGSFYDKYGALKDFVQNHALQLLALTAMESPKKLDGKSIRDEKARVLSKVKVKDVLLGQYKGYRNAKGVANNSKTETFAALRLEINNQRWKGVPFFIKVGKALKKKSASMHLKFKEVDCLLSKTCPSDTNYFSMRIQPNSGFEIELNSKVPGKKSEVLPIKMEFCEKCRFGPNTPEAYETLLEDVMNGDQSAFVRNDEIEYAWKIIDSIKGKVYTYEKGSEGPVQMKKFQIKHKFTWRTE